MELDALDGREMQIQGFQCSIHSDDDLEEIIEKHIQKKLQQIFKGERGNKIIRVNYQKGAKAFLVNAGFEEELYNEVTDWVREVYAKGYFPLVFEFRNFLSFSGPKSV